MLLDRNSGRTVLFLCTGNSARSILAEAILNRLGQGRFCAYSAGSQPTGRVNPLAIELLEKRGYPVEAFRSKSWDEFAGAGAPGMDLVLTVCDRAGREQCPLWPGHPLSAHWGIPDPAAVDGSEDDKRAAFAAAYRALEARIRRLVELPVDSLDGASLQRRLAEIGRQQEIDQHGGCDE